MGYQRDPKDVQLDEYCTRVDDLRYSIRLALQQMKRGQIARGIAMLEETLIRTEEKHECPYCNGHDVTTKWEREEMQFYQADDPRCQVIEIEHPVRTCTKCKISWTDHEGEFIRTKLDQELFRNNPVPSQKDK